MRCRALVVVACVAVPFVAGADDWSKASTHEGVVVRTREAADGVRELETVGDVDAPPQRVLQVLVDTARYATTMPYIESAREVHREGATVWLYVVMHAPLTARRDYCIRLTPSREPDGTLRLDWSAANEYAPKSDDVRVVVNSGHWRLVALDGGTRTRAEQLVHADAGGWLPKWLATEGAEHAAPEVYRHLRDEARRTTDPGSAPSAAMRP